MGLARWSIAMSVELYAAIYFCSLLRAGLVAHMLIHWLP
jgi:hypothetical protein